MYLYSGDTRRHTSASPAWRRHVFQRPNKQTNIILQALLSFIVLCTFLFSFVVSTMLFIFQRFMVSRSFLYFSVEIQLRKISQAPFWHFPAIRASRTAADHPTFAGRLAGPARSAARVVQMTKSRRDF